VARTARGRGSGSRVVDQWAYANGVALHFIDPGKPVQNAFILRSVPEENLAARQ